MVALGLKIAVLDLSLILFINSKLLCTRFAPLSNSKKNDQKFNELKLEFLSKLKDQIKKRSF